MNISIKGYRELSDYAKEIFKDTYKLHSQGKDMEVLKITEHKDHLKVYFKDEWYHYTPNLQWY